MSLLNESEDCLTDATFPQMWRRKDKYKFKWYMHWSDTDLIQKLLAMKIEATTAKMLAACWTHITIAKNMLLMGLATKAISTMQKSVKKHTSHGSPCSNCTKCHTPGREHYPAKDSTSHACQNVGYWKQKCRKSNTAKDSNKKPKPHTHH